VQRFLERVGAPHLAAGGRVSFLNMTVYVS
jgi:hypothetical protein